MRPPSALFAWFVCLPVLSCGAAPDLAVAPTVRPNIVFIFTDDHAAHAISAYGS